MKPPRVPSNIKLVLVLCIVLLVVLFASDYYKPQSSSLRQHHDKSVPVIISTNHQHQHANHNASSLQSTIAVSSSSLPNNKPKLFTCGFDLWNFGAQLFGDLDHVGRFGEIEAKPTNRDVLLQGGLNGPCHKNPETEFPGKILFVNSEARIGPDTEKFLLDEQRFVQLGPITTSSSLLQDDNHHHHPRALSMVTFGAIFFVSSTTPQQRQWILDPTQRPKANNPRDAVVFVVNRCGGSRKEVALELASFMTIHQNPKCATKSKLFQPIPKQDWTPRHAYRDNYVLYSKYKYCLVLENTMNLPNYITEKLFLAFMGGCLPIYGGSRTVMNIFNPNAFVYYDAENPQAAMDELRRLQANQTAYDEKMAQPILAHGVESANDYLSLAQDVGNGQLRLKIRSLMLGIDEFIDDKGE